MSPTSLPIALERLTAPSDNPGQPEVSPTAESWPSGYLENAEIIDQHFKVDPIRQKFLEGASSVGQSVDLENLDGRQ